MPVVARQLMVRLSTDEAVACPICGFTTHQGEARAFGDVSTHILQEHQLVCIHVGQETVQGLMGPWQTTVAVFGK